VGNGEDAALGGASCTRAARPPDGAQGADLPAELSNCGLDHQLPGLLPACMGLLEFFERLSLAYQALQASTNSETRWLAPAAALKQLPAPACYPLLIQNYENGRHWGTALPPLTKGLQSRAQLLLEQHYLTGRPSLLDDCSRSCT
jgi:hypothetical protein